MQTLTRFREITELWPEEKNVFFDFGALNRLVERDKHTRRDIELAYLDVMSREKQVVDYTELHFQIKYLIDEAKVTVNKILEYAAYKFPYFPDYFIEKIEDSDLHTLLWKENVEKIRHSHTFTIVVNMYAGESINDSKKFVFKGTNSLKDNMFNIAMMMKLCEELINNGSNFELEVE